MIVLIVASGCGTEPPINEVDEPSNAAGPESDSAVVRTAQTLVDVGAIQRARVGDIVTLKDIDNQPIRMQVTDLDGVDDLVTLRADVLDRNLGFAIITYDAKRSVVRADVDMGNELYVIRPEGSGHVVEELSRDLFLEPGHDVAMQRRTLQAVQVDKAVPADDPNYIFYTRTERPEENGKLIDVVVLYTDSLASRVGFDERNLAMTVRNNLSALEGAFTNSGVAVTRFNIARVLASRYTETGVDDECRDMIDDVINNTVPGVDVDAVRNSTRADVVMVVATRCRSGTSNRTGLAVQVNGSSDFGSTDNAILVTDVDSMAGAGLDATAHEFGHLLGAAHNVEQGQAAGYFSDSFGYCSRSGGSTRRTQDFRTIMSYSCGASAGLPTIPNFSSESVKVSRVDSMGSLISMSTGNGNQDNARALATTRKKAANFVRRRVRRTDNVGLLMTVLDS